MSTEEKAKRERAEGGGGAGAERGAGGADGKKRKQSDADARDEEDCLNDEQREIAKKIGAISAHLSSEREIVLNQHRGRVKASDKEYYMCTFDPDEQFEEAIEFLTRFGFVCLRDAVSQEKRTRLRARVDQWFESLQSGLKAGDWSTFINANMPDNFTSGVLDGIAPPNLSVWNQKPQQHNKSRQQIDSSAYETIMSFSTKTASFASSSAATSSSSSLKANRVEIVERKGGGGGGGGIGFRCGALPLNSVPNRENKNDVHVVVENDALATRRCRTEIPVYSVVREAPLADIVQGGAEKDEEEEEEDDEIGAEAQVVPDLRYRFDTLTHSQEAWDVRTDARVYRFFRRLLQAGDDLLVSIDRFLFQRPLQSRPKSLTEDWKNNFEQRPTWEQNPFWRGDPICIPLPRPSSSSSSSSTFSAGAPSSARSDKKYSKIKDGSLMMTQVYKRSRTPTTVKRPRKTSTSSSSLQRQAQFAQFAAIVGAAAGKEEGEEGEGGEEENDQMHQLQPCSAFFTGYQGLLALENMTADGGAVTLVPAFHTVYEDYARAHALEWSNVVENIVRAQKGDQMAQSLIVENGVAIAMRAGTMLIFDKRLPRWGAPNRRADTPALAMFISMWPRESAFDAAYRRVRALSVRYGIRCTALRHLTGHSATPARWKHALPASVYANYTMPAFTELGLCLLGVRHYSAEVVAEATTTLISVGEK